MQPVSSIAIVGAGSAGWLTALAINTWCPFVRVSLVRPRGGKAIGVGESTQGDFTQLLHAAGIDIGAFYRHCDATLKCGIFYTDWNRVGEHYWHPFADVSLGSPQASGRPHYTVAHHYQQMILREPGRYTHEQYYAAVHSSYAPCVVENEVSPQSAIAFHVDALRLTGYLETVLERVEVLETDDVDVMVTDNRVSSLRLDDGRTLTADLYVDCTGFNRALHSRIGSSEVLPYQANVNRAVAGQVPYADTATEATPYTGAHAHDNGWTWAIPLQSRIGSGYVYHADFCSAEQAEMNFRQYWGLERMRDVELAHIAFDSATLRAPWAGNVVAIGLAAGFIEPLEATGLNWTITSASLLCRTLAAHYFDHDLVEQYNAAIRGYIHDVQDFVDAHYKLSARRDSEFWRYQTSREYPERLEHRLALYAREMPNSINRPKFSPWAFHEVSWLDILNGYRFQYEAVDADPEQVGAAEKALQDIARAPRRGVAPLQFEPPRRPAAGQARGEASRAFDRPHAPRAARQRSEQSGG